MSGWVLLPACAGACVLVLVLAIENAMSEEYKSAWGIVHRPSERNKPNKSTPGSSYNPAPPVTYSRDLFLNTET